MMNSKVGSPGAFAAAQICVAAGAMVALRSNSQAAVVCGYIILFGGAVQLIGVLLHRPRKP